MILVFIIIALLAEISLQNEIALPMSPRVMGGDFARSGEYPYHVALLVNRFYICGGSIISETFVLTAAHCTYGKEPSQMQIRAGTIDLRLRDGLTGIAKEFIMHPQYNTITHDMDFALIRLSQPLQLGSATLDKIELSTAPLNLPEGTVATVTGYGDISGELEMSPRLKYAQVFVLPRHYCNSLNVPGVTDNMICTGNPGGGINSCQGDSGGPLAVYNKLYGVVSWGFGCSNKESPAMYAYVGAARDWIKEVAGV